MIFFAFFENWDRNTVNPSSFRGPKTRFFHFLTCHFRGGVSASTEVLVPRRSKKWPVFGHLLEHFFPFLAKLTIFVFFCGSSYVLFKFWHFYVFFKNMKVVKKGVQKLNQKWVIFWVKKSVKNGKNDKFCHFWWNLELSVGENFNFFQFFKKKTCFFSSFFQLFWGQFLPKTRIFMIFRDFSGFFVKKWSFLDFFILGWLAFFIFHLFLWFFVNFCHFFE